MRVSTIGLILLIGLAAGISAAVVAPRLAGPLLPASLRKTDELVEGRVERKMRETDRLLLTLQTPEGILLASFKDKVAEIDLLVQKGDVVTLAIRRYEPFVEDPKIERVRKEEPARPDEPVPSPKPPEPAAEETPAASSY
jgi:hypothetical protein